MTDDLTKALAEGTHDALAQLAQSNSGVVVTQLANELYELKLKKDALTAELAAVSGEVERYRSVLMPEAMAAMGAKEWTTTDGIQVKVKDVVQAGLPKDPLDRSLALEWLEEHQLGDVIKHAVSVTINKGDADTKEKVLETLGELALPIVVSSKDDVHPQTMTAVIRKLLLDGVSVPLTLFGVYVGKVVDVKFKD